MRIILYLMILIPILTEPVLARTGIVRLPAPEIKGVVSVEEAIQNRRSVRTFNDSPIAIKQLSQLLWAAGGITVDGITGPTRAYPSAGGIYPLVIYVIAGNVEDLAPGVYKYSPFSHALLSVKQGDLRDSLFTAASKQRMVKQAPVSIVIVALYDKTAEKYGTRGINRYVPMDAGHLGENVHLQAYALGLGTCMLGSFNDIMVGEVIDVESGTPVYIMPVGNYNRK